MSLAQTGDKEAYRELLVEVTPVIRALARRYMHDQAEISDVTQEVLISLHLARHTYDPQRPFLPWLTAITRRRITDELRKRGTRARAETAFTALLSWDTLELGDDILDVKAAAKRIPAAKLRVVSMFYGEGMTASEAAHSIGVTENNFRVMLHRALRLLREKLTEDA